MPACLVTQAHAVIDRSCRPTISSDSEWWTVYNKEGGASSRCRVLYFGTLSPQILDSRGSAFGRSIRSGQEIRHSRPPEGVTAGPLLHVGGGLIADLIGGLKRKRGVSP